MDLKRCQFLFMPNVNVRLTQNELRDRLVHFFPEFFAEAHAVGTMSVKIYHEPRRDNPGMYKGKAVVSGVCVDLEALKIAAARLNNEKSQEGRWTSFIFHEDDGAERDDYGNRTRVWSVEDAKRIGFLLGTEVRHVRLVTTPAFSGFRSVFKEKKRVCLQTPNLTAAEIGAECIIDAKEEMPKAIYKTVLDCFQAIARYNLTTAPDSDTVILFQDERSGNLCETSYGFGLSSQKDMLNFEEVQKEYGYVPLSMLNSRVININHYKTIASWCSKCYNRYQVLGLDKNLGWGAGTCKCNYDVDVCEPNGAVRFEKEKFTRLIYHQGSGDLSNATWSTFFPQMKANYVDAMEYRRIVQPMIEHELAQRIKNGRDHAVMLPILSSEWVEDFVTDDGVDVSKYFLTLSGRTTKILRQSSYVNLDDVEVFLHLKDSETMDVTLEEVECVYHWIGLTDDWGKCKVFLTILVPRKKTVFLKEPVRIDMLFNIFALKETISFLEDWSNGKIDSPLLHKILHPTEAIPVQLSSAFITYAATIRKALTTMRLNALNEAQRKAIDMARENSFTIINGPPGTGKTMTAAGIIISTACYEKGGSILAITPSTFSAHVLRQAIDKLINEFFYGIFPGKVLMMVDAARESFEIYHQDFIEEGPSNHVKVMHSEVEKMILNSEDERLKRVHAIKFTGNCGPVTEDDDEYWNEKVNEFETELLQSHPIQIWTTAAAIEFRFQIWKEKKIDCIVIDEAGFIPQAFLLPFLALDSKRVVHVGDYRQLRGRIAAINCELCGLSNSYMEWLDLGNIKIPSTRLTVQYRMHSKIASVVSELVYHSELTTAPSVPNDTPLALQNALKLGPQDSILVMSHDAHEEMDGKGVYNPTEVKVVENLIKILSIHDIPMHSITIITPYEGQKSLLLKSDELFGFDIRLIDEVQGLENDIVIVSMVRSGHGGLGHLKHQNRCNVMLSRAKRLNILVCNPRALDQVELQFIRRMMAILRKSGAVFRSIEWFN